MYFAIVEDVLNGVNYFDLLNGLFLFLPTPSLLRPSRFQSLVMQPDRKFGRYSS